MKKENLIYIYIIIMQLFLVIIGHVFAGSDSLASGMWPAIGFSAIFYLFYGKKALVAIFLGTLLGQLFNQFILIDNAFFTGVRFAIFFTTVSLLEVVIFKIIFERSKQYLGKKNYLSSLFLAFAVSATIGGAIVGLVFHIAYNTSFYDIAVRWTIGDFFGMAIFSVILYNSFMFDYKDKTKQNILNLILMLSLYIALSLFIFTGAFGEDTYVGFFVLFIPIYLVSVVYFKYYVLLVLNIIHISLFQIFYISNIDVDRIGAILVSLNIILFVFSAVAVFLKNILTISTDRKNILELQKIELEGIISKVHEFFDFSSSVGSSEMSFNEKYLKHIFNLAIEVFKKVDAGTCYIYESDKIRFIDSYNYNKESLDILNFDINSFDFAIEEPILSFKTDTILSSLLGVEYVSYVEKNRKVKASVFIGLLLNDNTKGGLGLDIYEGSENTFNKTDFELFKSFQASINNLYKSSQMFEQNKALKNSLVLGMARSLDLYDNYTVGHSEEVAILAKSIAKIMKYDNNFIKRIEVAGLLHDIGKLSVQHRILNKKTSLNEEEFSKIKTHSIKGYEILKDLEDMGDIALYVKHHHERWDGKGYPNNLKENNIPEGAQVLSICDAVSTMLSGRVYQPKKTIEECIDDLNNNINKQFSEKITNVMIEFLKSSEFPLAKFTNQ